MRPTVLVGLVLALVLSATGAALADSAPLRTVGPNLKPFGDTAVRMQSESIRIRAFVRRTADHFFGQERIAVAVHFHFLPGADEDLKVGFPLSAVDDNGLGGLQAVGFEGAVDGKRLVWRPEPVGHDSWATWPMSFRKGQPVDLDVSYEMDLYPYGKNAASPLWITYILKTGSYWAGTIGSATAEVQFETEVRPEEIRTAESTPGWSLKGNTVTWHWTDLKPDFDLQLKLENAFWLNGPAELAALAAKPSLTPDELARLYDGVYGYYQGDMRAGVWHATRGGVPSGQAVDPILPSLLKQLDGKPELADQGRALLYVSATRPVPDGGRVLYSPERFRLWLKEVRGLTNVGIGWLPWRDQGAPPQLDDDLQDDVLLFLRERIPDRFDSQSAAATWVNQAAAGLSEPRRTTLLDAAVRRVVTVSTPAPAPAPPAAEPPMAPQAPPPVPSAPARPSGGLWAVFSLAVLAGAALLLWRRHHTK